MEAVWSVGSSLMELVTGTAMHHPRIQISAVLASKRYVYSVAYPSEARKGNTRVRYLISHSTVKSPFQSLDLFCFLIYDGLASILYAWLSGDGRDMGDILWGRKDYSCSILGVASPSETPN